jgi:cardiolipin synthase (CMP-forming)
MVMLPTPPQVSDDAAHVIVPVDYGMRTSSPESRDGGLPSRRNRRDDTHDLPSRSPAPKAPPAVRTHALAPPIWLNLPNTISLARLPLAAMFVLANGTLLRLGILAAAAVSDWADGALARRTGRVTHVGEVLDPIADRTFMIAAVVWLAVDGSIPMWALPLLLLRDIGVLFGALIVLAIDPSMRLASRATGKRVTWLQFVAVGLILLRPDLVPFIVVPIALMGAVALVDYGRHALSALKADS